MKSNQKIKNYLHLHFLVFIAGSVVLAYNLEPIYEIVLALILFPEKEKMGSNFLLRCINNLVCSPFKWNIEE